MSSHDLLITQAQKIEKDFIEIHERSSNQGTVYYLKGLTEMPVKDLAELAFYLEKGFDQSEALNRKLNYTSGIRWIQLFTIKIKPSNS